MRVGLLIETVTHLVLALTTSPAVALGTLVVFGAHAFVWGTTSTVVRQRAVPDELLGRVGGVYRVAIVGGLVVGTPLGGLLAAPSGSPRRSGSHSPDRRSWSRSCGASSSTSSTTTSPALPRSASRRGLRGSAWDRVTQWRS